MRHVGSDTRKGAILVQVSFLILALMGVLALVIDLGIARATQCFMQASADAAAIEGLRLRDTLPDDERREAASVAAARVFDEDLDLATGPTAFLLGAGPTLETGVGGIDDPAGGLLVSDGPWLPDLQWNADTNAAYGDLVAGTYTAVDPDDPGNPDWHLEDGLYQRLDFAAADVAQSSTSEAFLVRLRRTRDVQGLDAQAGISSSGPTLPYLFGLGSGVLTTDTPETYDPRRDGITVRATSIAAARPAVAAGLRSDLVTGVAPVGRDAVVPTLLRVLAFEDVSWRLDFVTDGPFEVQVGADGAILGTPGGPTPAASGLAQPAPGWMRVGDPALSAAVPASVALPATPPGIEGLAYVALYGPGSDGEAAVTGFAAVQIGLAQPGVDAGGAPVLVVTGVKLASIVAPENASAVPALANDISALLPADEARQPLLAPVLAR